MYSLSAYGKMISDLPRMEAYASALGRVVKQDSVVVDLGSGPGIMAFTACQLGARRVYAIEPDNIIQVAREAAAANGFSDRIEFIQDFSTNVTLPEAADVVVSDLRGVLPWFRTNIPSVKDARDRFLAPGGSLVPQRDLVWAAVVEVPERYDELTGPWTTNAHGFDLTSAQSRVTNTWTKTRIKPDQLLGSPMCWQTIDYNDVRSANCSAEIEFSVNRPGVAHGLTMWFDCELVDGIQFSNRPGDPELIYGNALFPFTKPVEVLNGDLIRISIRANLVGQDYVWLWHTRIFHGGNSQSLKADFRQSNFLGDTFSPSELCKSAGNYAPFLNQHGQIQKFVLSRMDGGKSLEEIAAEVSQHFPAQFTTARDALTIVGELSIRYGTNGKPPNNA